MVEREGPIGAAVSRAFKGADDGSKQQYQALALKIVLDGIKADGFVDLPEEVLDETEESISRHSVYNHSQGLFSWDMVHDIVTVDGRRNELTVTEGDLLRIFVKRRNELIDLRLLKDEILGEEAETKSLSWHVYNLRHKIEPDPRNPKIITNVRGRGFVFNDISSSRSPNNDAFTVPA